MLRNNEIRGAGHRVRRVGLAVREFEHVVGPAGRHEGVVDLLLRHHGAQRLDAIGDLLGQVLLYSGPIAG